MKKLIMFVFFSTIMIFVINNYFYINKPLSIAADSTILIQSASTQGSGVIFQHRHKTFIWTCAHVVDSSLQFQLKIDGGTKKFRVEMVKESVNIKALIFNDEPRHVGDINLSARIIRISAKDDLALLEIPEGIFRKTVSFPRNHKYMPGLGTRIFHVGNFGGAECVNGVSEGLIGVIGHDVDGDGIIYDRVAMAFKPGCSGGGVFESSNGYCIGLIARATDRKMCNQGYIIPFRRMVDMATRLDCMWALNGSLEIPANYLDTFTDDTYHVPDAVLRILESQK